MLDETPAVAGDCREENATELERHEREVVSILLTHSPDADQSDLSGKRGGGGGGEHTM